MNIQCFSFFVECAGVIAGPYCYVLHNQKLSFDMAAATCLEKNGRLAWIKTAHRYDQVMDYILQHDAITDRSIIYAWTKMKRDVGHRLVYLSLELLPR